MEKTDSLFRYLRYLLNSRTKYDIHSPFLYDLIVKVFNDKYEFREYQAVEKLKATLLNDRRKIRVEDLGAGSKVDKSNLRKISNITRYSSKNRKFGRLLFRLARYFKPEHIIELGTSVGISTAYLASASPGSIIYTLEGSPEIAAIARENFKQLNLKNIEVIDGHFDDSFPVVLEKTGRTGLVFIDGNHRKNPTLRYFELCLKHSDNDTCLIFDDIHWTTEMESAWDEIIHNRKVTLSVDLFYFGIVWMKKELSKQHFVIRY